MWRANQSTWKPEQSPASNFKGVLNGQTSNKTDDHHHCWPIRSDVKFWPDCLEEPMYLSATYSRYPTRRRSHYTSKLVFRSLLLQRLVVSTPNIEVYWLYSDDFLLRRNHLEPVNAITASSFRPPKLTTKLAEYTADLSLPSWPLCLLDLDITNLHDAAPRPMSNNMLFKSYGYTA